MSLYLQVEPPLPEEVAAEGLAQLDPDALAQIFWDYAGPGGWRPLGALDETRALSNRGLVTFVGPRDLTARSCFGRTLYWLRARWQRGAFPLPPRLRRVLPNTTWALQVATVRDEIIGSGNGNAGQAFATAQAPVQPGQQLVVREGERPAPAEEQALVALEGPDAVTVSTDAAGEPDEIWVRWHAVPDFYESGARDRHYTLDPLSGAIAFGDGTAGMVPPPGQNNLRITYRTGGGERGNRAAGTIVELKSGVPYVDGVSNVEPAQGGAPREPIERLQARGPRVLRHRDRAITAQDLEDLAVEASADVARAAAIVPAFNPYNLWLDPPALAPTADHDAAEAGRMGIVVVPNTEAPRPTPSLGLLRQVQAHLQERCPATADLWVAGPEWIAVAVTATVVATSVEQAAGVADRVRATLERFLHPLRGGPDGQGWAFGRRPRDSDLTALVEAVDGVDHVRSLSTAQRPETADAELEVALERLLRRRLTESDESELDREPRRWLDRALVYSGDHQVTVAFG